MQHCIVCGKLLSERKLKITSEGLICSKCALLFFFCRKVNERVRKEYLKCNECSYYCPGHPRVEPRSSNEMWKKEQLHRADVNRKLKRLEAFEEE